MVSGVVFVCGIGFALKFRFVSHNAEFVEAGEVAVELADEAGLVGMQERGGGRVFGELLEGQGGSGGLVDEVVGVGDVVHRVVDLVNPERGLDFVEAMEAPLARGHFVDGEVVEAGAYSRTGVSWSRANSAEFSLGRQRSRPA